MMQWEDVRFPIPDGNGGMILPPQNTIGTQIVSYDVTWRDDILDVNDHFDDIEEGMSAIHMPQSNYVHTRLCDTVTKHNLQQPRPMS